jgi:hypothetical protein
MNEDADWPGGKAWITWKNIQKHYQPEDRTSARDLTSALPKINLKKNTNLMKYCLTYLQSKQDLRRLLIKKERSLLCRAAQETTMHK